MEGFYQQVQTFFPTQSRANFPAELPVPAQRLVRRGPLAREGGIDVSANPEGAQLSSLASRATSALNTISRPPPPRITTRASLRKNVTSNACQPCRKRKSKCDGGKPACASCTDLHHTDCWYDIDDDQRRKGALRRTIAGLRDEVAQFKAVLETVCKLPDTHPLKPQLQQMVFDGEAIEAVYTKVLALRAGNISHLPGQGCAAPPTPNFYSNQQPGVLPYGPPLPGYGMQFMPGSVPAVCYGEEFQPGRGALNGYGTEFQPDNTVANGHVTHVSFRPSIEHRYEVALQTDCGAMNGYAAGLQPNHDAASECVPQGPPGFGTAMLQMPEMGILQPQEQTDGELEPLDMFYFDNNAVEGSTSKIDNSQ